MEDGFERARDENDSATDHTHRRQPSAVYWIRERCRIDGRLDDGGVLPNCRSAQGRMTSQWFATLMPLPRMSVCHCGVYGEEGIGRLVIGTMVWSVTVSGCWYNDWLDQQQQAFKRSPEPTNCPWTVPLPVSRPAAVACWTPLWLPLSLLFTARPFSPRRRPATQPVSTQPPSSAASIGGLSFRPTRSVHCVHLPLVNTNVHPPSSGVPVRCMYSRLPLHRCVLSEQSTYCMNQVV